MIFEGAGEAGAPTVSVFCLPEPRLWDRRDAFVRLGRGHEARQTGALVGALCVGALAVLTQGHLVADVLTLVYVYTRHLVEIKFVTVEAVAGVALSHAHAPAVLTAVQDSTFLRSETLETLMALCMGIHRLWLVLPWSVDGDTDWRVLNAVVVVVKEGDALRNVIGSCSAAIIIPVWRNEMLCRILSPLEAVLISNPLPQTV